MTKQTVPKCPVCGRSGKPAGNGRFRCGFGHIFDTDPNEGGDFSDHDPSHRLERQETIADARRMNREDEVRATNGFRFKR